MADAVVSELDETVEGNKRVVNVNLTWSSGDTYVTGLAKVDSISFCPTTASAYGVTEAAGTVTLASGGALTGRLRVAGT